MFRTKTHILSFGLLILILFVLAGNMLWFGTGTFADVFRGYESWNQYLLGAGWNTLNYPSVAHPQYSYFVTWWSPAQWYVPYLLNSYWGISSIQVIQFLLIASLLGISLFGYYLCFKKLGFPSEVNLLALISIATCKIFYWHTLLYFGGDLFLLAYTPYWVLFVLSIKNQIEPNSILGIFLFGVLGLFFKNTALILLFSAACFIAFRYKQQAFRTFKPQPFLVYLVCFALSYLAAEQYLSLGETPAKAYDPEGYQDIPNNFVGDIGYSLGSPFGIFSRFTFFTQKLNSGLFANSHQLVPMLISLIFIFGVRAEKYPLYTSFLRTFCFPFLTVFGILYLQDRAVSYEMRHFAPVVFFFFPGFIAWFYHGKFRNIGMALLVFVCLADMANYARSLLLIEKTHAFWNGYKIPKEDIILMNTIEEWDKTTQNGLLVIEDYWFPVIAAKKNDKIVLSQQKENTYTVSGIELDYPDPFTHFGNIDEYSSVLLVASKETPFIQKQINRNFVPMKENRHYKIWVGK